MSSRLASSTIQTMSHQSVIADSLAALSRGDVAGHLANCTEDVVVEFPFATPPVRIKGNDALGRYLSQALDVFSLSLTLTRVIVGEDPDLVVAEYESVGSVSTTSREYQNSYITIFAFRGPLIRSQREYYNPLPALAALREDQGLR